VPTEVEDNRFEWRCAGNRFGLIAACSLVFVAAKGFAQTAELPGYTVIAQRHTGNIEDSPYSYEIIEKADLESAPQRRLDDVLRSIPGFSLFRRSSSRVAHPTTQGVSLRNIGPNGAGRTLVLLDGVPMNDPFGGWVYWNRLPIGRIQRVEILRGGGAGAWGNSALGGTIHLHSEQGDASKLRLETTVGDHGTAEGLFSAQDSFPWGDAVLTGGIFSTDGYPVVRADQRGAVDRNAYSEAEFVEGGIRLKWGENRTLFSRVSYFNEERGNGTSLAVNATKGYEFSVGLKQEISEEKASLEATIYYQNRDFSSFFPAVAADRSSELPALDQFDVPAEAWGGSILGNFSFGEYHRMLIGADARRVSGETNEQFFFNGTSFNFQRRAGGEQTLLGFFMEDEWDPAIGLIINASVRVDNWRSYNGFRLRTDLNTGEVVRREQFVPREQRVGNARVGFAYQFNEQMRFRGHFATGFRAPTLNELYRPFRVRSDITEANPSLDPERLFGGEIGLEWQVSDSFGLNLIYFDNRLEDAIANVTLAQGPGVVDPCGFVPNGGSCRQRRNLETARIRGFEVEGVFAIGERWSVLGRYLYSDARITDSPDDSGLEENRLAQSPEHSASVTVGWQPTSSLRNTFQFRYVSTQFENDANTLRLDSFAVFDWSTTLRLNEGLQVFLSIENVTETEIETGLANNGIVSIGSPRLFSVGFRWQKVPPVSPLTGQ
jgi:outer membrane cobalamin receptor